MIFVSVGFFHLTDSSTLQALCLCACNFLSVKCLTGVCHKCRIYALADCNQEEQTGQLPSDTDKKFKFWKIDNFYMVFHIFKKILTPGNVFIPSPKMLLACG